jgi:FkbM family methyltransferase
MSTLGSKIIGKFSGFRRLCIWMMAISNWPSVWQNQRQKEKLPPIRLRNGVVLHHGKFDSPLLLLDEVFLKRWYQITEAPPPNACMMDVGANIGAVTLFWANQSPTLQVHCYEPNPSAFATLDRNIGENGLTNRVRAFSEGMGKAAGTLRLWVDVPTDLSTAYQETSPAEGGRRIEVPVVAIDDAWARLNRKPIWLLKIDTEGAEADILEGASGEFMGAVRNAIVEYHDNIVPGSLARCQRILDKAGFECQMLHHPWSEGIIYASRPRANERGATAKLRD